MNEIIATIVDVFELPEGTAPSTTVEVDSLASLSLMSQVARRWRVRLDPARLERMSSIAEIADYIAAATAA